MKQVYEVPKEQHDLLISRIDKIIALEEKRLEENQNSLPDLMSDIETQEYLDVKRKTLLAWDRSGILKRHKIGGKVRYRKDEVRLLFEKSG